MGGGVGISVHAPIRISTEKTLFAMPETRIGFVPDVGASFFLSRLDGSLGTYLGLTGHRLKAKDVWMSGIATHYIPSTRIPALVQRLSDLPNNNLIQLNQAVEEFVEPTTKQEWATSWLNDHRPIIDQCFGKASLEQILTELEKAGDFGKKTLDTLHTLSPTALKVSLESIQRGKDMDLRSCFTMEYRLVQEFLDFETTQDTKLGVTSVLIEKSKEPTAWNPSWEKVSTLTDRYIKEQFFADKSDLAKRKKEYGEVDFENDRTYLEYPHRFVTGLPSEDDVKAVVGGYFANAPDYSLTRPEILEWFTQNWGRFPNFPGGEVGTGLPFYRADGDLKRALLGDFTGGIVKKHGLLEKVEWILDRFTEEKGEVVTWKKSTL